MRKLFFMLALLLCNLFGPFLVMHVFADHPVVEKIAPLSVAEDNVPSPIQSAE